MLARLWGKAIERPHVQLVSECRAQACELWQACVGGFGHRTLHVELKNALGPAGPALTQTIFRGLSAAGVTRPEGLDGMGGGRPVGHKIRKKGRPRRETVAFEVAEWKPKRMVDGNNRRARGGEMRDERVGQRVSRPARAAAGRGPIRHKQLGRRAPGSRAINLQARLPLVWRAGARVVDSDAPLKRLGAR